MNEVDQAPEPFDPSVLTAEIAKVAKDFDELESSTDAPVPRALHDLLQDGIMKVVASMQNEIESLTFYLASHEDRIADIEEGGGSQLLAEDAGPLIAYLKRSVEIFESLIKTQPEKFPGLDSMVEAGQDMIGFLEDITLPDDAADEASDQRH